MIGIKFVANESKEEENHFGWRTVELVSEPMLTRTVHRKVDDRWREALHEPNVIKIEAHYYTYYARCDGEFVELDWEEFSELIGMGVYSLESLSR